MALNRATTPCWALLVLFVATRLPLAESARSLEQAAPTAVATAAGAAGRTAPAAAAGHVPSTKGADAALLLAFRASFENGDEVMSNWRPGSDPCAWMGISCIGGNVTGIDLMNKGLRGQIPQPDGWKLPATVADISLGNNNDGFLNHITGPIPPGWKLPPALETLFLGNLPLGGGLSANWKLPPKLLYFLANNCSLSGPLPNGWSLPPLMSIQLMDNQLEGTMPKEFAELDSLVFMNIDNNPRLGGPIPVISFNTSWSSYGVSMPGCNFSGPVPAWPNAPKAALSIHPGNPLLCGPVPATPSLISSSRTSELDVITSLPPCPGQESDGSGLSSGAVAGIVVGSVVGGTLALMGAALLVRRKRRQTAELRLGFARVSSDGNGSKKAGASVRPSTGGSTGLASVLPFNPFAGGPRSGSPGGSAGNTQPLPLSAASSLQAGSSSGSNSLAAQQAELAAKLEVLERTAPSWLISPSRLTLDHDGSGRLALLGAGAYARVYRGWLAPAPPPASVDDMAGGSGGPASGTAGSTDAVPVALKVMEAGDVDAFIKEAALLQRLAGSEHVVALHGACVAGQSLVVVMEVLEGGDLRAALSAVVPVTWRTGGQQIALDIAEGLAFLHNNNVTHRDLKSKNVLLTADHRAKISDVGTAALHSATYMTAGSSKFGGTLAWAAPEMLLGLPCSHKADIYSLGVVLWEIATQQVPRRGDAAPPTPSADCPAGLSELIGACLQQEPSARPSAQQVLERLQQL